MADLLLEIFSEEIPARMQKRAGEDLKKRVTDALVEAGITYASAAAFSTPRRLTLTISDVLEASKPTKEERRGPRADAPEKAIEGFLRATGLGRDALETRQTNKGDVLFAVIEKPGRKAADVIGEIVPAIIRNFPWPKSMRWGAGNLRWVRPIHSVLSILVKEDGAEIVPFDLDGIPVGNTTEGHRFMGTGRFSVASFEDYEQKLRANFVMLDPDLRAETIWHDATTAAFAQGLEVVADKGLLAEVAGLVEWPVVLMGDIAPDFMGLPVEVLQTSMREHQKFFSVKHPKTGRIEKFVTVANRETADDGATILAGNQKVLFARLSDAKFFWENDLRVPLADMAAKLSNVTFHNKLGTQAERVTRIAALAREIAPFVGADPDQAEQAAKICKADLSSEMVYEFPELQGLMGRYYALAAGVAPEIATACEMHYKPLGPSDVVPTGPVSVAVALADKIDTLTGFWAIDEKPTGSKDPFALRRAALGVIRLVLENGVRMPLRVVFAEARPDADAASLLAFFHERLKVYLRDQGITHDVIDACLAMPGNDDLVLLASRATALSAFLKTEDGENLLQGFKRANNILAAEEKKDGVSYEGAPDVKYAIDDSERALFATLDTVAAAISPALKGQDFAAAMSALAGLRAPIDAFFTAVQVNTEQQIVRRNRLCLLNRIREVMGQVARFEAISG